MYFEKRLLNNKYLQRAYLPDSLKKQFSANLVKNGDDGYLKSQNVKIKKPKRIT